MIESIPGHRQGPIFVVGSPRSGTSVLTWCLGQHPNIVPQEESGWMGPLAVDLAVRYGMGCTHGERSQLSTLGISRDQFLETFGNTIDAMVVGRRQAQEALCRAAAERNPSQICDAFQLARSASDSKSRWVDGTPEYSLHIYALKKLFPNAKLVHIVRDARTVVESMLRFKPNSTLRLFDSEQKAYEYWLRTVRACVQAETALGGDEMIRVRYDDLVQQPETTLERILTFLGEPFDAACMAPLTHKINSSNVPSGARTIDPATDPHIIEEASRLSERLQASSKSPVRSATHMKALETAFQGRVDYVAGKGFENEYDLEVKKTAALTSRLNRTGWLLIGYLVVALIAIMSDQNGEGIGVSDMVWLTTAIIGLAVHAYMRRAGLRELLPKVFRKHANAQVFH